jgi:predicted RNase H-like nuclease (RuvC/YqgF family)
MSRFVPVSFEKWAEMVKAQSDLVRYKEMCDELDAECTRLKAEVERLKNNCEYLDTKLDEELDKSAMLCGQVERLTKAGDAMAGSHITLIQVYLKDSSDEWHQELHNRWLAAKEGKQP